MVSFTTNLLILSGRRKLNKIKRIYCFDASADVRECPVKSLKILCVNQIQRRDKVRSILKAKKYEI